MSTAAVAPSTRPSVRPSNAQGAISRRNAASAASDSGGPRLKITAIATSTETLTDQAIQRAHGMRIAAHRPARPLARVPGVDVAVQASCACA
ncbi:MAG: hypothetical protein QM747_13160 [Nocardioides sp.]